MTTKADFEPLSKAVLEGLGGADNVSSVTHCATRLRFKIKDASKVNESKIENTESVITLMKAGGQHQVVIGNDVPFAYDAVVSLPGMAAKGTKGAAVEDTDEDNGEKPNAFNAFIQLISSLFTPILWPLAGIALVKAFLSAGTNLGWFDTESTNYIVFAAIADGLFFFLPMFLAVTAARRFKMNEFIAMATVAPLVYPSIIGLASVDTDLKLLGIPLTAMDYSSSVIPAIVTVWLASYVQHYCEKILPSAVRNFMTPVLVLLIMVPIVLLTVGPLTMKLAAWISAGVTWLFQVAPWLAGGLLGAFWQVLVIFGLHWGFVPIFLNDIANLGHSAMMAPLQAAVMAQAAAVTAVALRSHLPARRKLAGPSAVSGILAGVTEPAIYGINLPLKVPFYAGVAGGAVGGIIIGLAGVSFNSFTFPSLLAFPAALGEGNFLMFVIGTIIAMVIAFVGTWILLPRAERSEEEAKAAKAAAELEAAEADDNTAAATEDASSDTVLIPVNGTIIPLDKVEDKVFASGAMGESIAVEPSNGQVLAPVSGKVIAAPKSGHAFGIKSARGVETLVHVGIDTVQMNGEGFTPHVKVGDRVQAGQLIVDVDLDAVAKAGYKATTILILTNSKKLSTVEHLAQPGLVVAGEPALRAAK